MNSSLNPFADLSTDDRLALYGKSWDVLEEIDCIPGVDTDTLMRCLDLALDLAESGDNPISD